MIVISCILIHSLRLNHSSRDSWKCREGRLTHSTTVYDIINYSMLRKSRTFTLNNTCNKDKLPIYRKTDIRHAPDFRRQLFCVIWQEINRVWKEMCFLIASKHVSFILNSLSDNKWLSLPIDSCNTKGITAILPISETVFQALI